MAFKQREKIVKILMAGENKKISKFGGEIEISKSKRGKREKTIFSIFKKRWQGLYQNS